jgi:NAD(P)-dependent dehydrogenase (short-subunit alcohol dehydrogenase family)
MSLLAERHALVTGASGAIGGAIAEGLAERGARILAVGRDSERLDELARRLRGRAPVSTQVADLSDDGAIERVAARALGEFGGLDILVHAAGEFASGPLETSPAEVFDRQLRINARVPYLLTQRLLSTLLARRGEIVFVNSTVVLAPRAGVSAYAASKAALRALADSLRAEVNGRGVRVLSVFPGRTASPMQEQVHREEGATYRSEKLLQPADVAAAVVNALAQPRTAEVTDVYLRPMQAP